MKLKIYILLLLLNYNLVGKAQQLLFNNISNELNLPTQESYNVMQDSKGYIWISTEAGVCKYNGSKCKVFDKKNGIPENSCYVIIEDNKGQIWMLTSANRILRYTNDRLTEAPFSKNFYKQIKSKLVQGYLLYFKNDSIIISTQHTTQISSVTSSKVLSILPDTNYGYYFIKNNGNLIEVKSSNNGDLLNKIANKGIITLGINTGKAIKQISLNYPRCCLQLQYSFM